MMADPNLNFCFFNLSVCLYCLCFQKEKFNSMKQKITILLNKGKYLIWVTTQVQCLVLFKSYNKKEDWFKTRGIISF